MARRLPEDQSPEDQSEDSEDRIEARRTGPCPVVGIGASAGGIDALQKLLPNLEPGCGLAFVVVLHLDPTHKSMLADLLGRFGRLPAVQIEDGMAVAPDTIYVIPPNAALTMRDCRLHLAPPVEARGLRAPIDEFLTSLAEDQGANAACIILSGAGSDGTLGVRAIKEHGGLALAQEGAQYESMMRSAVATGLIDLVLPAEDMAAKLTDYFRQATRGDAAPGSVHLALSDGLEQVFRLLRTRTGHDFSGYKTSTIARRIQRRMHVSQSENVDDFLRRLREDPRQTDLLFQDLLIGVTNFFRDATAWDTLESEIVPRLYEGKGPDDSIRVWVPGCSTGEEAYSLAILLRDHMPKSLARPKVLIFASDIDERALETARTGRYPAAIANNVPAPRLERHFVREDGTFRISGELREMCLFSSHNMLRDAPFSRLDLVSCRNLLIYLKPDLQARVIPLFHYALRDGGYLFLGSSENVTRHARLFATVDKGHRVFVRRPQAERRLPEFPISAPSVAGRAATAGLSRTPPGPGEISLQSLAEREILERYAPAHVIVDRDGTVLQSSGRTGKYLELPAGTPTTNLFSMARRGLKLHLRAAVDEAALGRPGAARRTASLGTNGGRQDVELIVQPLGRDRSVDGLFLVLFQDIGAAVPDSPAGDAAPEDAHSAGFHRLETELQASRERLQAATEELESSNEELKSGNEELSSMNEELQSANEELETSKEELQSINEELQTVNAELAARVEELARANSDIANLLDNTQIATVFLDGNLTIKSFTPTAKDLFHLVESDVGRPITHVRARFGLDTIEEDAKRVQRTLARIETTVIADDGKTRYVMCILPYRTVDNVISGVVMTFTDITRITAAEAQIVDLTRDIRDRVEDLETVLDLVPVGIFIVEDPKAQQVKVNRAGAKLLGDPDERRGLRHVTEPIHLFDNERELELAEHPLMRAALRGEAAPRFEGQLVRADGGISEVMISATPLATVEGDTRGAVAAVIDVSPHTRAERQREVLLHELQHRVKNILATVAALAARMLKTSNTLEEFSSAFLGRLLAMGAMHELLSARNWDGAELRALVAAALAPHLGRDGSSLSVEGPPVVLKPNAAATLGMVFHELATNAVKYGALSAPGGRIRIDWRIEQTRNDRRLSLTWQESGGPRVSPPGSDGFGRVFVERSVQYELDGTAAIEFEPSGVTCTIAFPFRHNVERIDLGEAAGG